MTAPKPRLRVVTAAFWCWVVASVMLIAGGLLAATATLNLPTAFRGAAILTVVTGCAMAVLAGKSRSGDVRYRRAAVALALTIVVLVGLTAVFGLVHFVTLFAIFPLIAGAVLMTRPSATTIEDTQ